MECLSIPLPKLTSVPYYTQPLILAVDRNRRNLELIDQYLCQAGYSVITTANLEEVEGVVNHSSAIHLAVVDISGFNGQIWMSCDYLKSQDIPFVIISPIFTTMIQHQSLKRGAKQLLVKPFLVQEFLAIIRNMVTT